MCHNTDINPMRFIQQPPQPGVKRVINKAMKVKEIIEELKKCPQDLDVYVPSHNTENDYCKAFSISRMELINNDEDSDHENIEDDYIDAIVIDEQ